MKIIYVCIGIEKWLIVRGLVQPSNEQLKDVLKTPKTRETHQFLTESSHLSGDAYQLDPVELSEVSEYVKDMDTIDVLLLNPATFKYADGLTKVMRQVEDPFEREIAGLTFQ